MDNFIFYNTPKYNIPLLDSFIKERVSIYHLDAANFFEPASNKPLFVECEALPAHSFITNENITRIFVESKSAGRIHLHNNPKVKLLYPSVKERALNTTKGKDYITLLAVGYGSFIKGYDVLFRIYKELKKDYKIKLIIAGAFGHNFKTYPEVTKEAYERADFDKIKAELLNDPNVIFKSFSRETLIKKIYPTADIYIHLCRMETFGFSILEAMSFGLPVVSCYFKAIPEMIEHGKNGFLIKSTLFDESSNDYSININSKEWADNTYNESLLYVKELIENEALRIEMKKNSLNKVNQLFNVNKKNKILSTEYEQALNN